MAIIAVVILILYYYFFITFEKDVKKPQNIPKPVVHLNNEVNGRQLQPNQYYEYHSGLVKGPYEYSIQKTHNDILFQAHDNDFNLKTWVLPLNTNYFWHHHKVVETDSCFNVPNHSNVKAEGKMLFDYIQDHHLTTDPHIGTLSTKIFHSDRLFYFKCHHNRIESLHSCPPGTLLNNQVQCEKIRTCTGQVNHFQYPDEHSKFKYFKCVHEIPHHMSCPPGEIFKFDQCGVPQNLCEVRSDGFLQDIDRQSFLVCLKGQFHLQVCPPYTYALKGQCENEMCENKQDNLVPIPTDNGTFEYAAKYGKCKKGQLIETLDCPTLWNHWETNVDILHLPQVFDPKVNSCTKPVLCENVKITNPNILVPQYAYGKYLKNWGFSQIFDLVTGYKCDASGNRVQETVDPGELIINFQKTKISPTTAQQIPTPNATQFFDVVHDRVQDCPPGSFFDGFECKMKNPNAFSFRHLDIFELDGLHSNGWMKPHTIDHSTKKVSCTGDYRPMNTVHACVHKDCAHLQFLYQLKGSIKIDDQYECFRKTNKIEKHKYPNPYHLKLDFWDQQLTPQPKNICTFGTQIKTGHFVSDSTVFMTCDPNQPFVFCPSPFTETIQTIGNTHACVPKQSVYELTLAPNTNLLLHTNEISGIQIPTAATITVDTVTNSINNAFYLTVSEIVRMFNLTAVFFHFMCNVPVVVQFSKLPTNPENVYLEKGVLKINPVGVYDIIHDKQAQYITPFQYNLKDYVTDFKY